MEEKNKKEADEKLNNSDSSSNSTEKSTCLEEKIKNEKIPLSKEDNPINITPEELDQILNQLKEKFNVEDGEIRIVKIEKKKVPLKEIIFSALISYLFDFILIISLNGYIGFTEYNFLKLSIFSLIFSTVEYVSRRFMMKYFFKLMFISLGTILIPVTILSFVAAWLLTPGLPLESDDKIIIFFVVFLAIRIVMKMLLMNRQKNKIISRFKGGKK